MALLHELNFHHLHYFWAVAKDGGLSRAARNLRISPSALSAQIRLLESQLGTPLFVREQRGLTLTEGGRIALSYAEAIFGAGQELVSTFTEGRTAGQFLRIGAVSTLSRNFQQSFLQPLLGRENVRLSLETGSFEGLLDHLLEHSLDLVLANHRPKRDATRAFRVRRIARQGVSLVGHTRRHRFRYPEDLDKSLLILPGPASDIRTEFDAICERLGVTIRIKAEVDDMGTLRLLARNTDTVALVPSVVVRDELASGVLKEYCQVPELFESFYAITVDRQFPHPLLASLLHRKEQDILGQAKGRGPKTATP